MKSLGLLGLVFDTGLSVTPLMGHLGCLASHCSVPVGKMLPNCFLPRHAIIVEAFFFNCDLPSNNITQNQVKTHANQLISDKFCSVSVYT